jgi:hypothetical protein
MSTDVAAETNLGTALTQRPDQPRNANTVSSYRAVASHATTAVNLGPLAELPGYWEGTGFSLIARPHFDPENRDGFFLQLNLLRETIEFNAIGSPVPNRGSQQEDINLFGVTYLHRVTDAATGGALHIEPGIWMSIPGTAEDGSDTSITRLSTIPHGNSVCAVGFAQTAELDGIPDIPSLSTVPYDIGAQPPAPGTPNPYAAYNLAIDTPYRTNPIPSTITQALVDDPITMLRDALQGQTMTHVTRLILDTANGGGVGNIPFLTRNADTTDLECVFAIERVQLPEGNEAMQLQYQQVALLNFRGKSYPHVTVGTLIRAF